MAVNCIVCGANVNKRTDYYYEADGTGAWCLAHGLGSAVPLNASAVAVPSNGSVEPVAGT